jgi:hypothetical protein
MDEHMHRFVPSPAMSHYPCPKVSVWSYFSIEPCPPQF